MRTFAFALGAVLALGMLAGCTNPEYAVEPAPDACAGADTTAPVSRPEGAPTNATDELDCPDEEDRV